MSMSDPSVPSLPPAPISSTSVVQNITGPVGFWDRPIVVAIATTLLGFVLTTVIGVSVYLKYVMDRDAHWEKQQEKRDRENLNRVRYESVQKLILVMMERRAWQDMVIFAYERRASLDEIMERKKIYDTTYAAWNRDFSLQVSQIKHTVLENDKSKYDILLNLFEGKVLSAGFRELDRELTSIYDVIYAEKLSQKELKISIQLGLSKRIADLKKTNTQFKECTTPLVQALIDLAYDGAFNKDEMARLEKNCSFEKEKAG